MPRIWASGAGRDWASRAKKEGSCSPGQEPSQLAVRKAAIDRSLGDPQPYKAYRASSVVNFNARPPAPGPITTAGRV